MKNITLIMKELLIRIFPIAFIMWALSLINLTFVVFHSEREDRNINELVNTDWKSVCAKTAKKEPWASAFSFSGEVKVPENKSFFNPIRINDNYISNQPNVSCLIKYKGGNVSLVDFATLWKNNRQFEADEKDQEKIRSATFEIVK